MVGRAAELAAVTAALAQITTSGGALVVEGEPGIGKSTLLSSAAAWAAANGYGQLTCSGLQSHTEVGFAGLHELIHPLLPQAHQLPRRQRTALMTAFGLEDGPAPDRLLVSLAVLGLLEEAATQRRLLLVADDAQWLDQSSLDVLAFVARRLTNAPLLLLCALRTTHDGSIPLLDGLPRLPLAPLPREEAQQLLTEVMRGRRWSRRVDTHGQQCVLDQANGNPLAVIELSAALGEGGTDRAVFSGEPLPTSRRVERAFLSQLASLPEDSRLLLLLIAASGGALAEIIGAAQHAGLDFARDLGALERAGLVLGGGGRLRVRHPLIRSTVYGAAPLVSRSVVHRALAAVVTDPVRAAWHRAEATFGQDEDVAAELEAAARRARSRGAGAEAAAAMRRAAALSDDPDRRVARLTCAAEFARSAGLIAEAADSLREAEALTDGPSDLPHLAVTRFVLTVTAAIPGRSAAELLDLAATCPDDGTHQRQLLWAAAIDCRMHGLPEPTHAGVLTALRRVADTADPAVLIAAALVDDTDAVAALQRQLPDLIDALRDDPLMSMSLAFASEAVADRHGALQCWECVQHEARRRGSLADECEGLRGAANLLLVEGRIGSAIDAAQTALRMAEDMNLPMTAGSAAAILARALVCQGDVDGARAALVTARRHLAADPAILWHDDAHWAAGLLSLCEADHAGALDHMSKMVLHRTSRRWAVADLAEAAAGCGRADTVRAVVDEAGRQAESLGVDSVLVHRANALLADRDDDSAEHHFRAALAAGSGAEPSLESARTCLLYGEWLRRRRRITEARAHLTTALTAFDAAGAQPFLRRAAAELRAAGGVAPVAIVQRTPAADVLTPQELQIAHMAAAGMTNREIADKIYVSHRTVAAHLYKVFPKLGITSRNQLHGALGRRGAAQSSHLTDTAAHAG